MIDCKRENDGIAIFIRCLFSAGWVFSPFRADPCFVGAGREEFGIQSGMGRGAEEELVSGKCLEAVGNPALWIDVERAGALDGRGPVFTGAATERGTLSRPLHLGGICGAEAGGAVPPQGREGGGECPLQCSEVGFGLAAAGWICACRPGGADVGEPAPFCGADCAEGTGIDDLARGGE